MCEQGLLGGAQWWWWSWVAALVELCGDSAVLAGPSSSSALCALTSSTAHCCQCGWCCARCCCCTPAAAAACRPASRCALPTMRATCCQTAAAACTASGSQQGPASPSPCFRQRPPWRRQQRLQQRQRRVPTHTTRSCRCADRLLFAWHVSLLACCWCEGLGARHDEAAQGVAAKALHAEAGLLFFPSSFPCVCALQLTPG